MNTFKQDDRKEGTFIYNIHKCPLFINFGMNNYYKHKKEIQIGQLKLANCERIFLCYS